MLRAQRTRKRKWWLLAAAALCVLLIAVSYFRFRGASTNVADRVLAITQRLPVGVTAAEVEDYFVQNNIGYSFVERDRTFYALIPNVEQNVLVTGNIRILATLDYQRQLEHLDVRVVYPGP